MPRYFARVELHDADSEDYELLRKCMKEEGFSHCHKTSDTVKKKLPTGLYVGDLTETSVGKVAKSVKTRADDTGLDNEVVVIESVRSSSILSKKCS